MSLFEAGLRGNDLLKMSLTDGTKTEHIWMQVSQIRDGIYSGQLANEPTMRGHRLGDPVSLRGENIEDWMINTATHDMAATLFVSCSSTCPPTRH